MKKIFFILLSLVMISCGHTDKKQEAKNNDDFLKVPSYETKEPEVKPYTPVYEVLPSSSTPTYWYVVFDELNYDSKGNLDHTINWHKAIQLNTPYFNFIEARKGLPAEITGECYFEFILQINKEAFDSYQIYRVDYFKD